PGCRVAARSHGGWARCAFSQVERVRGGLYPGHSPNLAASSAMGSARRVTASICSATGEWRNLADAQDSGSCEGNLVGVQVPPRPPPPRPPRRRDRTPCLATAVIWREGEVGAARGGGADPRGRGGGRAYDTTKAPVIVVGCTSQRKKYVPAFSAGTL